MTTGGVLGKLGARQAEAGSGLSGSVIQIPEPYERRDSHAEDNALDWSSRQTFPCTDYLLQ